MADVRIPSQLPAAPARPANPARMEAVRAAQRAFFDTALAGETQAASAPRGPAPAASNGAPPPSREVRAAFDPDAPAPSRLLRPGSLLDIKV